jgi:hypothetical protein
MTLSRRLALIRWEMLSPLGDVLSIPLNLLHSPRNWRLQTLEKHRDCCLQQRLAVLAQRKSEHEAMIMSRLYPAVEDDQTRENEQMNFDGEHLQPKKAPEDSYMQNDQPVRGIDAGRYQVQHPWSQDDIADERISSVERKSNVARENLRINQEQEEMKRCQKAELRAEEMAEAKAQFAAEEGFFNRGATSDKVPCILSHAICYSKKHHVKATTPIAINCNQSTR